MQATVRLNGRARWLSDCVDAMTRQLAGESLTRDEAGLLRDQISTDEMTPAWACLAFDESPGDYVYVGLRCGEGAVDAFLEDCDPLAEAIVRSGGLVHLCGKLPAGVGAKDLALHWLSLPYIRDGRASGQIIGVSGEAAAHLSTDGRATLTNMVAEIGGFTGLIRNFPGRSGPGQMWLGSPATVAASALAGCLVGFDQLQRDGFATPGGRTARRCGEASGASSGG